MKLTVTATDILAAKPGDRHHCGIARAFKRELRLSQSSEDVTVKGNCVRYAGRKWRLPTAAWDWMIDFDARDNVKPITFEAHES